MCPVIIPRNNRTIAAIRIADQLMHIEAIIMFGTKYKLIMPAMKKRIVVYSLAELSHCNISLYSGIKRPLTISANFSGGSLKSDFTHSAIKLDIPPNITA
jgi:hypothetical protein